MQVWRDVPKPNSWQQMIMSAMTNIIKMSKSSGYYLTGIVGNKVEQQNMLDKDMNFVAT